MAFAGGFETSSPNFDKSVRDAIQKRVVETLRAGLIALPKGAVVAANVMAKIGDNFTLRVFEYPDLEDGAVSSLNEGVPPSAVKLSSDYNDFEVEQVGAWTAVTDIAEFQSPHNLRVVSRDKIARLAAQTVDNLALQALLAHGYDSNVGGLLTTKLVLDSAVELASRDVGTIDGVGYYALCHPKALRGLTGEDDLNGYIDLAAQGKGDAVSTGVVGRYRGVTFITSTRIAADASGLYPVIFLGKNSVAFGDISTIEYFGTSGADSANPLAQFSTVGFKGILGGTVMSFKETTDGNESDGNAIDRIYIAAVADGSGS